jgi:hypothetical protein
MIKQPLQYVTRELDKLYEKEFPLSDVEGINKHCEFISAFIHACGWDETEITNAMFGWVDVNKLN